MPRKRVTVGGVSFDAFTEENVVSHVRSALRDGVGGWILTPNVDILRQLRRDSDARAAVRGTSIVVADGMPLIWASRLAGTPLPQRVCGSDLVWSLSRGLAEDGRSIFILGGEPLPALPAATRAGGAPTVETPPSGAPRADVSSAGVPPVEAPVRPRNAGPRHAVAARALPPQARSGPRREPGRPTNQSVSWYRDERPNAGNGADRAAARLTAECPGLQVAGAVSPPYGFDRDRAALAAIRAELIAAQPDLVLVGIGFPRQERLIAALREALPRAWFLGCGMAIGFVAGEQRRAPAWMQRTGVEWMHRLAAEPRRLADRYLRHDLPFAVSLLGRAAVTRMRPHAADRSAAAVAADAPTVAFGPAASASDRPSRNERPAGRPHAAPADPWA